MTDQTKALLPVTPELLPCPFCGTVPTLMPDDSYGHCGIGCHCEAEPFVQARKDEPEKAITAWNTRSQSHSLPGGTAGESRMMEKLDEELMQLGAYRKRVMEEELARYEALPGALERFMWRMGKHLATVQYWAAADVIQHARFIGQHEAYRRHYRDAVMWANLARAFRGQEPI